MQGKKDQPAVASAPHDVTLYERLGRRPGIEKIVEYIWANHTSNPVIKQRYVKSNPAEVKRLVTEMCCAGFGGPEAYTGKDMVTAHTGDEYQRGGVRCGLRRRARRPR